MDDTEQMQEPLRRELVVLRQRLTELEAAAAARPSLEEALRERHRQYQHLVEHSLGLLCIHDLEGVLLLVNPAAARALGYPPEAGVGRNLREFLAPAVRHLFDEYLERIRRQPMDSGLMRVVTHTGEERVWLYRNLRYEEPGKAPYVIGHAQDITERVLAEQALKHAHEGLEQLVAERTVALQRAEEESRGFFTHAGVGMYVCDPAGHFLKVNPAFCAYLGYSEAELLHGMTFWDITHPDFQEITRQTNAQTVAGLRPTTTYEKMYVRKDGTATWGRVNGTWIYDVDGNPIQGVGVVEDITARKQAEEAIRKSEERFRHLVENSLQGIMIHCAGTPVFANQAYAELYGYDSPEDILRVENIFQEIIAPEDRDRLYQYFQCRLRGEPAPTHYTCRGVRRDGTYIWVENLITVVQWEGEIAIQCSVVDISERKQTEEALRQSHAHFHALVQHSADIICVLDAAGNVHYYSPSLERVLGYSPHEVIEQNFFEALHPDDRAQVQRTLAQLVQHPSTTQAVEFRVRHRDGSWRTLEAVGSSPIESPNAGSIIVNARDITERKREEAERQKLENQLRQAQKMESIGTLAGGIAHEFNNVLAAILGFAELTQYALPQGEAAWSYVQEVLKAGHRAKNLVQQLLTFGHPEEHEQAPVPVAQVVREALPLMRAILPSTIEIRLDIATDASIVLADRTQLHQVVLNLCSNAEYAMRQSGSLLEIVVDTVQVDDAWATSSLQLSPGVYVRLIIRDTGHGIAPEIKDRIFDPFFTTTGVGEGSGMGLAVVHGIVTSHNGVITVESTPGEGTTCTIYLPQCEGMVGDVGGPEPSQLLAHGKGRILFVDDEKTLVRVAQLQLEHLGYEVVAHTASQDALEVFRAAPDEFVLVITDQTMPAMTGKMLVEALRRIRSDIPIILCTGFSHLINDEQAQALGVDAFMMKPMATQELAATIKRVLDRRAAQESENIKRPSQTG
jgi:PAS domain S-box-containing protein